MWLTLLLRHWQLVALVAMCAACWLQREGRLNALEALEGAKARVEMLKATNDANLAEIGGLIENNQALAARVSELGTLRNTLNDQLDAERKARTRERETARRQLDTILNEPETAQWAAAALPAGITGWLCANVATCTD